MFAFINNIGPFEVIIILLIALIVVGPGKLPEVARSMGKATREFKKATTNVKREFEEAIRIEDEKNKSSNEKTDKVTIEATTPQHDIAQIKENPNNNLDK